MRGLGGLVAGTAVHHTVYVGIIGHFLAPAHGNVLFAAVQKFQEQVVLHCVGLDGAIISSYLGVCLALLLGHDGKVIGGVGIQLDGVRHLTGRQRLAGVKFGKRLVRVNVEQIHICILGHIPGERNHISQIGIYPGFQVHGSEAAGQVQLGHFVKRRLGAGSGSDSEEGCSYKFQYVVVFHGY